MVVLRSRVREKPFFHSHHEHHWKFESLGRVQGHEPHAGIFRAVFLVGFRQQRQPVNESAQGRLGVEYLVVACGGD